MPLYCLQTDASRFVCDALIHTESAADCAQLANAKKRRCKTVAFALHNPALLTDCSEALCADPVTEKMQVYLLLPAAADRSADRKRYMRMQLAVGTEKGGLPGSYRHFLPTMPLAQRLAQPTETFSEMLLRLIDRAGLSDAECYKRAYVSRQHFAKIRADKHYRPKKKTVLAFAIALRLGLSETNELLQSAGFTFSHSSKFDIVVEYYISRGIYDLAEINGALYDNGEELIGVD